MLLGFYTIHHIQGWLGSEAQEAQLTERFIQKNMNMIKLNSLMNCPVQ